MCLFGVEVVHIVSISVNVVRGVLETPQRLCICISTRSTLFHLHWHAPFVRSRLAFLEGSFFRKFYPMPYDNFLSTYKSYTLKVQITSQFSLQHLRQQHLGIPPYLHKKYEPSYSSLLWRSTIPRRHKTIIWRQAENFLDRDPSLSPSWCAVTAGGWLR